MTQQGEQSKEAEELRAPEVVKPLAASRSDAWRDRDSQKARADSHRQDPPTGTNVHAANKANTQSSVPQQPKTPVPLRRVSTPTPHSGETEQLTPYPPPHQSPPPSPENRAWIAIPILAAALSLLWYAISPPDVPSNALRVPIVVPPETIQPVSAHRAPSPVLPQPVMAHVPVRPVSRHRALAPPVPETVTANPRVRAEASWPALPSHKPLITPSKSGRIRLSAYGVAADGRPRTITGNTVAAMRQEATGFNVFTNIAIPFQWRGIPAGDLRLALSVPGYHPATTNITVMPGYMHEISFAMQPRSVRVRFDFPVTNTVFDIYSDTRRLGDSKTDWSLTPFVPHHLTFKAKGWRPKRVKMPPFEPGKSYRQRIDMERIASGLRVAVHAPKGDPPKRGHLSINGSKFVEVEFPFERNALPAEGVIILALAVDGFNVPDSTQRVVLVDSEIVSVIFTVEKQSWVSRLFGYSERPEEK